MLYQPCSLSTRLLSACLLVLLAWHGLAYGQALTPPDQRYLLVTVDVPRPIGPGGGPIGPSGLSSLEDIADDLRLVGFFASGNTEFSLDDLTDLRQLDCGAGAIASITSVSTRGQLAGTCEGPQGTQGVVRDRHGRLRFLDVPGAILTEGLGLNNQGQVVGDYLDSAGVSHGFVWTAGTFAPLDVPFPGGHETTPSGINTAGQVVGIYTGADGLLHGFLYAQGTWSMLDVPGAVTTLPADIADSGVVIGVYHDADGQLHSFLREADGTFHEIAVPFAVATVLSGLNNRGYLAGSYVTENPDDPNDQITHGLIAIPLPAGSATAAVAAAPPAHPGPRGRGMPLTLDCASGQPAESMGKLSKVHDRNLRCAP